MASFAIVSVYQQAEFNFKESRATQRWQIQRLQYLFVVPIALLIYCLVSDVMYASLLELILLLVLFRARMALRLSAVVESFALTQGGATATINGQRQALLAYGLDYSNRYLALVSLTSAAGQTYRCLISPALLGPIKYRQFLALLKASAVKISAQRLS